VVLSAIGNATAKNQWFRPTLNILHFLTISAINLDCRSVNASGKVEKATEI
jgi:hypothetical protein